MSTPQKTDATLQQDVLRELAWDPRVSETDVGVTVHHRVVTLTGTLDSWGKRLAAQQAAHRVAGVLDVANELSVKLAGSTVRDDTDLARAVRFSLRWDVSVPDDKIFTTVADGVVSLEGEVDLLSQREDAERAIARLTGVREVRNRIKVVPTRVAGDVQQAIRDALTRHAAREASHIGLEIRDGGVVELTGRVQSFAEKQLVLGAARSTPGVRQVDDHISIGG
jgi:hyperosmotically inducible protein